INIPTQASDQNNIQQTQTTNLRWTTSQLNTINQMQLTPQIDIPMQVSTQYVNPVQEFPLTDQMNVMNWEQNQEQPISIQKLTAFAAQNPNIQIPSHNEFIRHPLMNMQRVTQQPFMQPEQNTMTFPIQN